MAAATSCAMSLNLEQMKLSGFEPDPDLNWEKIGIIPLPDRFPKDETYEGDAVSICIDEHRVLVIDQAYGNTSKSYVRLFDARTRKWSNEEWPSLNNPRRHFGSVMCNGKVYVIGGILGWTNDDDDDENVLDSIECLDVSESPRQWTTLGQRLGTPQHHCRSAAVGMQVFIFGGLNDENDRLTSVEKFNTETGQLIQGPVLLPQHHSITAATVNNTLLMFATGIRTLSDMNEVGMMRHWQPNWGLEKTSIRVSGKLIKKSTVVGDCVLLTRNSLYDTKRRCCWDLPPPSLSRLR